MPQRIRITGIRAEGHHGARPGERDEPQPFVVDVELEVDARDDDLGSTADYHEVVDAVRGVIEGESHAIIETIAQRVAATAVGFPGVRGARAFVHKPAAAERLGVEDVFAEAATGSLA